GASFLLASSGEAAVFLFWLLRGCVFSQLLIHNFRLYLFVKYFGAMYLEACLFCGWLMARDLNEWGLRGVYEVDRQGNKRPITKGRVFDPSDIRKVEDR